MGDNERNPSDLTEAFCKLLDTKTAAKLIKRGEHNAENKDERAQAHCLDCMSTGILAIVYRAGKVLEMGEALCSCPHAMRREDVARGLWDRIELDTDEGPLVQWRAKYPTQAEVERRVEVLAPQWMPSPVAWIICHARNGHRPRAPWWQNIGTWEALVRARTLYPKDQDLIEYENSALGRKSNAPTSIPF